MLCKDVMQQKYIQYNIFQPIPCIPCIRSHQIASGRSRISKRCVNSSASPTVKPQLLWRWPLGPRVAGRPRRVMRQWRKPCLGPCTDSWGWLRMICRYHGAMPMLSTYFLCDMHWCDVCLFVCPFVCVHLCIWANTQTHAHTAAQVAQAESISELLPTWQEIKEGAKRCPAADKEMTN